MNLSARVTKLYHRISAEWRVPVVILGLTTLYAVWVTRHVWGGVPSGEDTLGHIVRTNFALHDLFPHFRTDGWLYTYGTGSRPFLTYGPGYPIAIGIIRLVTFGQLSTVGAVAFVGVFSYAAVPWSIAFFCRRIGFAPLACALCGVLMLGIDSNFGGGLTGLYSVGLQPNTFAIPMFFVTIGALLWFWQQPNRKLFTFAVLSTCALVLTHQISVLSLIICMPVTIRYAVAQHKVTFERIQWIWLAVVAMIGLTLFWLLPAIGSGPEHGVVVTLARPTFSEFWHKVWEGQAFAGVVIVRLALLAWVITIWRAIKGKESFGAVLPILLSISLVFVSYVIAAFFGSSDISLELPNRAFVYIAAFGLIPLGLVCFRIYEMSKNLPNIRSFHLDVAIAGLFAIFALVFVSTESGRDIRQTYPQRSSSFTEIVNEVNKKIPPTGRILLARFDGEFNAAGVGSPPRWMVFKSNHWNLHMFGWETSPAVAASDLADRFGKPGQPLDVSLLRRFGVSDVIIGDTDTKERLDADPLDFKVDFENTVYRAYQVLPAPNSPRPQDILQPAVVDIQNPENTAALSASNTKATFDHLSLSYTSSANTQATAAITWSRGWHAKLDGKSIALARTNDSILGVSLPAGTHKLEFNYELGFYTHAGQLVSLLALLAFCVPTRLYRKLEKFK